MTLPLYVPVQSSSGANLAIPSAGAQATGFVPGDNADAQSVNALLNYLGNHLESIVDGPSYSISELRSFASSTLQQASINPNGNPNGSADMPLFAANGSGIVVRGDNALASLDQFMTHTQGLGQQVTGDSDLFTSATGGLLAYAGRRALTAASRLATQIAEFGRDSFNALYGAYSSNLGATWTTAPNAPFPTNGTAFAVYACFALGNHWYVGTDGLGTGLQVKYVKSSSLDLSTATWSAAFTLVPRTISTWLRYASNGSTVVILPDADNQLIAWDGTTATYVTLGTVDTGKTTWRGSWNGNVGIFAVTNAQGELWISANGTSWARPIVFAGVPICDIQAHGRGFVVAAGTTLYYLAQDHTQTWQLSQIFRSNYGGLSGSNAFHLTQYNGRIYAARVVNSSGYKMELYRTGVHPADAVAHWTSL